MLNATSADGAVGLLLEQATVAQMTRTTPSRVVCVMAGIFTECFVSGRPTARSAIRLSAHPAGHGLEFSGVEDVIAIRVETVE